MYVCVGGKPPVTISQTTKTSNIEVSWYIHDHALYATFIHAHHVANDVTIFYRYECLTGESESVSGISGEENEGERMSQGSSYRTPLKDKHPSTIRAAHSTGYNKKRQSTSYAGFAKLQYFSESKRTSGFWKERLGKRDLTSVLSSPLSQKLF
jgi:hypothetical protein